MARIGISYKDVAEVASQLIGNGVSPTVEQVRIITRTGSSTTIANHLRQWKTNRESTSLIPNKENLPPEFVSVMQGLWERVINHSEEKVTAIENGYQKTIAELQLEVAKYKTNNQRWQKLHDQWVAEKNLLTSDKLILEQALEFAHKENTMLSAKQDSLLQQLRDKQERIDELHRLHKQTQENLEHYRESTREQQLLDQQQHEEHRQQLQFTIERLNKQLTVQNNKMRILEQENQVLQHSNVEADKRYLQVQTQLQQLSEKLEEVEKDKIEYLHASQHWQSQHKELHKILDNKTNLLVDIQAEAKLLSQRLLDAEGDIKDVQDQNKLISHERWTLAQEKAGLEGQLKQMEKMISA